MSNVWDEARVKQYVDVGKEERWDLDYKAADALDPTGKKNTEITKDVSAMANAAGGIIIYGIREYQDKAREHLPEKIDPIDRTDFSKERLEHVISNIQPKIPDLNIYPVSIHTAPHHAVYVVEIPESYTAHQALDKRYYKRFEFQSVAMEDYEVRDVMGRRQFARIELEFKIMKRTYEYKSYIDLVGFRNTFGSQKEPEIRTVYEIKPRMVNVGKIYAQYVIAYFEMPCAFIFDHKRERRYGRDKPVVPLVPVKLEEYCKYSRSNTVRDLIKSGGGLPSAQEYGSTRYVPLLPGLEHTLDDFRLIDEFESIDWGAHTIKWTTHADNAPPNSGKIAINEIEIVAVDDRRTI